MGRGCGVAASALIREVQAEYLSAIQTHLSVHPKTTSPLVSQLDLTPDSYAERSLIVANEGFLHLYHYVPAFPASWSEGYFTVKFQENY